MGGLKNNEILNRIFDAANNRLNIGGSLSSVTSVGSSLIARDAVASVALLASGTVTGSASGADVADASLEAASSMLLVLDVTAASGTTPTLDVAVQAKVGSNYANLCKWAQTATLVTQAVNPKRDISFATAAITLSADPAVSGALAINNFDWLTTLRVKYVIAGTDPSFTFGVTAYPIN